MKKKLFTVLLAVVASIGLTKAEVYSGSCGTNLIWELNTEDSTLTISGNGNMVNYYSSSSAPWYSNRSSITSIEISEGVTSIGYNAFYHCSKLTSVNISNSVTKIESGAFTGCSVLKSVHIPDLAAWCAISFGENYANPLYYAHKLYLNGNLVTDLVIPNSVTRIGNYAFFYCYSLTSVTIPNSVTSIGNYAFSHCSNLTSVSIGNSVTTIGEHAFESCLELTSIDIPNSVTSIGKYAFSTCLFLTSIEIPNSVTNIESFAFYSCSSLKSVHISNIAAWCTIAFGDNYANPLYEAHNLYLNGSLVTDLVIPDSVKNIGNYAFYECNCLTSVTIGNSVTGIGNNAFYNCSNMVSVTIGNSVTYIGSSAFNVCSNLKSIYPLSTTPPVIESSTFKNINNDARVYLTYGTGLLGAYANAEHWKELNFYPLIAKDQYVGATSYKVIFDVEDITLTSIGIEGGEQQSGNTLEYIGLEPESEYQDVPIVLTANTGETETVNVSFTTTALELTTKASKPVSAITAILLAETNMSDAEVNCGFEYKRNDAPDDMAGTKVFCPVASGQMAGRLKNLNDQVYYKYRAFYQSAAGNMYYGDWQYIFTGDVAVAFDPILYTYGATIVRENEATISGYALAGSEDFTEQGFEYWAESRINEGANAPSRMSSGLGDHVYVQADGIALRATLTDLDAGTVYRYRVYGKVGDQYYYGTEQTFTTQGIYEEDAPEAIDLVETAKDESASKFFRNGQIFIRRGEKVYTLQGQEVR